MNDKNEEIFRIAKSIIEKDANKEEKAANKEETQKEKKNRGYASEEVQNLVCLCSKFCRDFKDVFFPNNNGIEDIIYTGLRKDFDKINKEYNAIKVNESDLSIKDAEHNFNNAKKIFDKLEKEYSKNSTSH